MTGVSEIDWAQGVVHCSAGPGQCSHCRSPYLLVAECAAREPGSSPRLKVQEVVIVSSSQIASLASDPLDGACGRFNQMYGRAWEVVRAKRRVRNGVGANARRAQLSDVYAMCTWLALRCAQGFLRRPLPGLARSRRPPCGGSDGS